MIYRTFTVQMPGLKFLYRSSKLRAPLTARLRFRFEGKDYTYDSKTNVVVSKLYWNGYHSKKRITDPEIKNEKLRVEQELNIIEKRVIEAFHSENELNINKLWFQNVVDDRLNKKCSGLFLEVIDYYIEAKSKELAPSSIKTYKKVRNKVKKIEDHYQRTYLIDQIDRTFFEDFISYYQLHSYSANTTKKEWKCIKSFVNFGAEELDLTIYPNLNKIILKSEETEDIYLTIEELEKIKQLDLTGRFDNARDWLIISCFTAQRISDFSLFSTENIIDHDGQKLLRLNQQKTKKNIVLPILSEVQCILDKRKGSFPRKISSQKYNDYIKEICRLAGITEIVYGAKKVNIGTDKNPVYRKKKGRYPKCELVTSHIGRRSFATNYYGIIPTPLLMSATGHSTEKQFLDYIKRDPIDNALMLAKMLS